MNSKLISIKYQIDELKKQASYIQQQIQYGNDKNDKNDINQ